MASNSKPPYTSVSDIDGFFERVKTIAEPKPPKKVDSTWVTSYRFETAHPSAIPAMLRWLGVIDDDGHSTGVWDEIRIETTRRTALARLMKQAYEPIFDAIDVENATLPDLEGAFVSAYAVGDPRRHIKCFQALGRHSGMLLANEVAKPERERTTSEARKAGNAGSSLSNSRANRMKRADKTSKQDLPGKMINVTLNVEIPAGWTGEQIRQRIADIANAVQMQGEH